jgi:hypothetical protein
MPQWAFLGLRGESKVPSRRHHRADCNLASVCCASSKTPPARRPLRIRKIPGDNCCASPEPASARKILTNQEDPSGDTRASKCPLDKDVTILRRTANGNSARHCEDMQAVDFRGAQSFDEDSVSVPFAHQSPLRIRIRLVPAKLPVQVRGRLGHGLRSVSPSDPLSAG